MLRNSLIALNTFAKNGRIVQRKVLGRPSQTSNNTSLTTTKFLSVAAPQSQKKEIKVTFIKTSGERIEVKGKIGDNLLDVVVNNNIDLDGFGACEGTLTCSTCHLIFAKDVFDKLPSKPCDEELDMLDLAYDLTDTSRLGCQVTLTPELDGLEVRVPTTVNDARS